jgi:hypothetical protein
MTLLKDLILERMTFNQLMALSDSGRKEKSRHMDTRSLRITPTKDGESWIFSYKSNPSTTQKRYQGYIKFLNDSLKSDKSADDVYCIVDCNCPDFKYRFAYNDAKQGASITGKDSWNKNNGAQPLPIHRKVGLCGHLISLAGYLKTKIDSKKGLNEGELRDYAVNRSKYLIGYIEKLEKKYDDLDDKSLNTTEIQKALGLAREELKDLEAFNSLKYN